MNYARERLRFYMSAQLNYQLAAALSPVAGGGCRSSWPIKALARPGQRVIQRPRGARAGRRWGSGRNAGGRCGKTPSASRSRSARRPPDRKTVVSGKSVSGSVEPGGGRIVKKKKHRDQHTTRKPYT